MVGQKYFEKNILLLIYFITNNAIAINTSKIKTTYNILDILSFINHLIHCFVSHLSLRDFSTAVEMTMRCHFEQRRCHSAQRQCHFEQGREVPFPDFSTTLEMTVRVSL